MGKGAMRTRVEGCLHGEARYPPEVPRPESGSTGVRAPV